MSRKGQTRPTAGMARDYWFDKENYPQHSYAPVLKFTNYMLVSGGVLFSLSAWLTEPEPEKRGFSVFAKPVQTPPDSLKKDTLAKPKRKLSFFSRDRYGDPFTDRTPRSPLLPKQPSNVKTDIQVDTAGNVSVQEKVGQYDYRPSTILTFKEFSEYNDRKLARDYWRSKTEAAGGKSEATGRRLIPKIAISPVFDRIFGGNFIDFQTNGFVTLDFGAQWQRVQNPNLPIRQQRFFLPLNFDQQINLNFTGKVGEKMKITGAFDTKASFQFEQNFKLDYTGYDHDIIQKIEAGNVSMPLNSTLIQGAQNLFGLKTQMRFGRLNVTGILANQRSRVTQTSVQNGVQRRKFEFKASEYEDNRHFFLGQFFRNTYEPALRTLPIINSGVQVTRLEVYVTNRNNNTETLRNLVAFLDLGDPNPYKKSLQTGGNNPLNGPVGIPLTNTNPSLPNALTGLLGNSDPGFRNVDAISQTLAGSGLQKGTDFEILRGARKLSSGEYSFNPQLGYVSLNTPLRNDEIMAVAFEYTYNGQAYKVGELTENYGSRDENQVLFLKMLRPATIQLNLPTWNLMMKNVYSLGTGQLSREGFQLRAVYKDDLTGVDNPTLQEGLNTKDVQLLEVFNLDRLNPLGDPQPDGNFDWVEGVTVDSRFGRIIFPVLEPFGSNLTNPRRLGQQRLPPWLDPVAEPELVGKYVFSTLYRSTKQEAQQAAEKNKFFIKGSYQTSGASNQVPLGLVGVDPNSVVVTVGGNRLTLGRDYIVENGQATIINEGILQSGQEIVISSEQPDLFQNQVRTVTGARLEYQLDKDFSIGSTLMRMRERPLLRRVAMGNEPTNNTVVGFDVNLKKDSRFLTKMLDKLPFLSTKEISTITFNGEFAKLFPGVAPLVQGNSFIDDFEAAETPFNLGSLPQQRWRLGATPRLFAESASNALDYTNRRAKLAWYSIDNTFYRDNVPGGGNPNAIANHYTRDIIPQEVFPQQGQQQVVTNQQTMDLAYYPQERGMYNYNPALDAQGRLTNNPKDNWAALSRGITYDIDFDNANVQYIEFWMMDPFINSGGNRGIINDGFRDYSGDQRKGGDIYFNLGNISEDAVKDGLHTFENGFPSGDNDNQRPVKPTIWGTAPGNQYLNNAFDNAAGSRIRQDIGLDGLNNDAEKNQFSGFLNQVNPQARPVVEADPSADNFFHPLDSRFEGQGNLLLRYKNFNGYENNSPEASGQDFSRGATTIPDNEDLNTDQTINDVEGYYQYKVRIDPNQMRVGSNYIVSVNESNQSGENVKWYQFRIPVREFTDKVGDIEGFKSIRFMRMFLTNFAEPHVLRLVNFQLVANQWRVYADNLTDRGLQLPTEPYDARFTLGTVNIEENSSVDVTGSQGNLFPYKVPPGLPRDQDITTLNNRVLNEQSLRLCADELRDRDARAVFKNVNLDFINYERLKMFLHAETREPSPRDTVRGFLRLGTDFSENYYEIEVRLKYSTPNDTTTANIWPAENEINVAYKDLAIIKSNRNRLGLSVLVPYSEFIENGRYRITVVGNPDYSAVQILMVGMRNAASADRQPISACVWANELRSEGFDTEGGFAATARLNIKLADFATINAAGSHETFGFGGIQQRISERARQNTTRYNIAANVNLEKLLPQWLGVKIPMFVGYERERIKPRFNPLDPDVPLNLSVESRFAQRSAGDEREYRKIVEDNTTRRSLNFTNVQKIKLKPDAKNHLWDLSNFTLNYSYSDITRTNISTALYSQKNTRGGVGYAYNLEPKYVEPFKNVKFLDKPAWKWLKEFNFALAPSSIAVRGDLDRLFTKTQLRNADPTNLGTGLTTAGVRPLYEKYFTFNRSYDLRWNLTRSLSLDYSALANTVIDEPIGEINNTELRPGFSRRDSVLTNLRRLGRMKNFRQQANATYRLPLDKFPLTDWLAADVRYGTTYTWRAAAVGVSDTLGNFFGNFADNSRQRAVNGRVDLLRLYNKIPFLKKINEPVRRPASKPVVAPSGVPPVQPPGQPTVAQKDTVRKVPEFRLVKGIIRAVMTARNVNFSYAIDEATTLPGFLPNPRFFGLDSSLLAPGIGFGLLGSQDPNIRLEAASRGWLSNSRQLNLPFMQTWAENFTAQADLEPFRDFKVRMNVKRTKTAEYSEIFRRDSLGDTYQSFNPARSGSYSISFVSLQTAFQNPGDVFEAFERNALALEQRLNEQRGGVGGRYDTTSQDVLIPAFLSAYTGRSLEKTRLTAFPKIPLPNWNITYAGLSKIEALKRIFSSVNLTHGYSSTYSVGSFRSPQDYANSGLIGLRTSEDQLPTAVNDQGQFVSLFITDRVTVTERFSPLIGVDLRTPSRFTARIAYNKERAVSLLITNRQVSEISNQDVTVSLGYTKNNLKIPFLIRGEQKILKNDVQFRCDVRFLDSKTIQRRFKGVNTPVAGNFQFQLKPTIQYTVNQRVNVTVYFERSINRPTVSTSFPRSDTRVGFRLQYNLSQ